MKRFMTLAQIAKAIPMKLHTVYDLRWRGALPVEPALVIGKNLLFPRGKSMTWVRQQRRRIAAKRKRKAA